MPPTSRCPGLHSKGRGPPQLTAPLLCRPAARPTHSAPHWRGATTSLERSVREEDRRLPLDLQGSPGEEGEHFLESPSGLRGQL